jgi:chromosome segregation ATPase
MGNSSGHSGASSAPDLAVLGETLRGIRSAATGGRLDRANGEPPEELARMAGRLAAVERRVRDLGSELEALERRVGSLDAQLGVRLQGLRDTEDRLVALIDRIAAAAERARHADERALAAEQRVLGIARAIDGQG